MNYFGKLIRQFSIRWIILNFIDYNGFCVCRWGCDGKVGVGLTGRTRIGAGLSGSRKLDGNLCKLTLCIPTKWKVEAVGSTKKPIRLWRVSRLIGRPGKSIANDKKQIRLLVGLTSRNLDSEQGFIHSHAFYIQAWNSSNICQGSLPFLPPSFFLLD